MKLFQLVIICFLLLVNFISNAFCQDITLSWDPSPTAGVSGYMVHYKAEDSNLPFNGTGADQGSSPIDVGAKLTTTLTSLDDETTYYFSVTAYDYNNNQSAFSNIVNNDTDQIIVDPVIDPPNNNWSPILVIPENNALTEPIPVFFRWDNDDRDNLTYTLYYGTNEEEVTNAGLLIVQSYPPLSTGINLIIITISALLLTIFIRWIARSNYTRKLQAIPLLVVIILGGILTACGGGGGGGGSESGHTSVASDQVVATSLYAVETNNEVYYRDYDMSSDTTYYWKVIATDITDPTTTYISEVRKFKTDI